MNTNLSNIRTNTNAMPTNANNTFQSSMNNTINTSNNDSWTNSWHSANPLVMNHQLASPQSNSSNSNNNFSAFDDIDPFTNTASGNSFAAQKPAVNYIYPTAPSGVPPAGVNNISSMNKRTKPLTLTPQQTQNQANNTNDNKNFNILSQQDILNFLN